MPDPQSDSKCYSPSLNHHYLMEQTQPALSYRGGDVYRWQNTLRVKLLELLGVPVAAPVELEPEVLWQREHPLGMIQKVVFRSEPFSDVPAYVCLPKSATPPYTFMICVQGHSTGMHNSIGVQRGDETAPLEVPGDRDFAIGCMQRGIAALCIEQRSLGERRELIQSRVSPQSCQDAAMHALMLGRTLIGERVFDVDRGIDYLATRGDARMDRIGIMGNSGGGTTSLFAAALLPRLAFAMPSCYFNTFAASIMAMHHCVCNYIPGILQIAEMADIMGLFAPKPVVIVAGQHDDIFPIEATQAAFAALQTIYRECSADDHCHLVVGHEGHRFYADLAWPVMLKEIKKLDH